jgi:hypothetical protein
MSTYLAFQVGSSDTLNTFKVWNSIASGTPNVADLLDETGASSGYGYSSGNVGSAGFGNRGVGDGDASWVDEVAISRDGHNTTSAASILYTGTPGESVDIEYFVSQPLARGTTITLGGRSFTFPFEEKTSSTTYIFSGLTFNSSGEISGLFTKSGEGTSYMMAARIGPSTAVPTLPVDLNTYNAFGREAILTWGEGV